MIRVIIFGLGSMGRRHAKILLDNFEVELFAYRANRAEKGNDLNIKEIYTWEEVREVKADVAFVTNPTFLHVETAIECARLGMHLFIEKPLSSSLKYIDELQVLCGEKKLTCCVAYCLRFHPVIKKIKELIADKNIYHTRVACSSFLPHWRKDREHLKTYSAFHEQGGGVLLDLSHEFDYIQYLLGTIKDIKGNCGRISNITVDSEDFADMAIELDNGAYVNLHLNFLSLLEERSIKITFKDGFIAGDLIKNELVSFYKGKKEIISFKTNKDNYLKEQLEFFFNSLSGAPGINSLEENKNLLHKILDLRNKKDVYTKAGQ